MWCMYILRFHNKGDFFFLRLSAEPEQQKDLQHKLDTQYGKALDGFVLVIDREGDIVYISESVSTYLGMAQVSLFTLYPCLFLKPFKQMMNHVFFFSFFL